MAIPKNNRRSERTGWTAAPPPSTTSASTATTSTTTSPHGHTPGSPRPDEEQKPIRLSVNMNPETAAALRDLAMLNGITVTEAVRRAVSIAHFVEQATAEGKSVQIADQAGRVKELVLM